MKTNLGEQYDKIINEGASIKMLYAFSLIMEDDRSFGMGEKEMEEMAEKAVNSQYNVSDSIESIVDMLLSGVDISGDDEEWYY